MESLLIEAITAAKNAGDAILAVYGSGFTVEQKEDRSPLTLADRRSHEVIAGRLSSLQKGKIPLLSEEGRNIPYEERKAWDCYWLVDPLDGTKEFIKRNGEFTVNIALMEKDRPVMGVVLLPVKDVLYFAAEGMG
ncbi:MAG: 3'(2'),5'-bisphosphate nucleotidase CysQ, partial [Nitrospirota bacterium]|nr:3'(2'),5'-bisphosphate nucleotidase CysQ [Nitrospirota bacterium]